MAWTVLLLALLLPAIVVALHGPPATRIPTSGVSISDRNVLLPHSSAKSRVAYTLYAYNGCFKWSNSNPDDILITIPLPADATVACEGGATAVLAPACSTEAIISSQASAASGRTSATITAEDIATGHAVRCDVFLDRIARIEILTTTRTMHRDNVEELFVQAFDSQGNIFSSLENLNFEWSIMPSNPNEASGVLKFVTPDGGDNRREGYAKLVHGISVGRATVAVRLTESEYASVAAATAQLTVLEPLELSPGHTAYVTPGASLAYSLLTFKRGSLSPVELPSAQYVWLSSNTTVATVAATGVARALQLGSSEIAVQSVNLTENTVRSTLHVVPPGYVAQQLLPLDPPPPLLVPTADVGMQNWVLINGGKYATEAEVFDLAGHRIHVLSNLRFVLSSAEPRLLLVSSANTNGSRHLLEPKAEGSASLTLSLTESYAADNKWHKLTPPIVLRQDVLITSAVRLTRQQPLLLPAEGFGRHSYQLHATGGSGEYTWYSSDGSILGVNGGLVTVQGRGDVTIVVADRRNVLNAASLPASALPPASLRLMPSTLETQVGYSVTVAIAVRDSAGRPFDNCTALPLEFVWTDGTAFALIDDAPVDAPLPNGACALRSLMAVHEGHSTLVLSLTGTRLKDETTVFAFSPLSLSPASPALVTLGSTLHVYAEGGPLPWLYEPSAFVETLEGTAGAAKIAVRRVSRTHASRIWAVTCLEHGAQTLTVSVGNRPSPSNSRPALLTASLQFDCRWPDALVLHPVPPPGAPSPPPPSSASTPSDASAPIRICSDATTFASLAHLASVSFAAPARYLLRGDRVVSFNVTALDEHARPFVNFSSLALNFASTNASLANWLAASPSGPLPRDAQLGSAEGTVTVSVLASDWNDAVLRSVNAPRPTTGGTPRRLQRDVEIGLRLNVQASPTDALLLNHEHNTLRISTTHGSGFLHFATNASHVVTLLHEEGATFADVVPRGPGLARIVVTDTCLGGATPVALTVRVADVAQLTLRGRRFVRLGDTAQLSIEAADERGVTFAPHSLPLLALNFSADPDGVIAIEPLYGAGLFNVRGLAVGRARLVAVTRVRNGMLLASASKALEVYGPIRLMPRSLLLVLNAAHQLYSSGGPSQETEMRFTSDDVHVANVTRVGVVQAVQPGNSRIRVHLEGLDPDSKEALVYGVDEVPVHVQLLSGIRIVLPAATIDVGAQTTLRVAGIAGETGLSIGGLQLPFRWELSDPQLLSLASLSAPTDTPFSVRALALLPGSVRITVRLAITPEIRKLIDPRVAQLRELTASTALTIVEPLRLVGGAVCGELLLPPGAQHRITTNRDGRHLTYHLLSHPDASDSRVLELGANNGVVEARRVGRAVVSIRDEEAAAQVSVQVTVRAPALLRLWPTEPSAAELPLGASLTLRIEVRDDTARLFDSTDGLPLLAHTSNSEVLSLLGVAQWGTLPANTTELQVRGVRSGEAVVRVALAGTEGAEDMIRIRVANALLPALPRVHIGGRVQFSSTLPNGTWKSDNDRVVSVSPSGLAEARALGDARVYHHTASQETHAHVHVVRVASIEVLATPLIQGAAKQPTSIPLRFLDTDGNVLPFAPLSSANPFEHNIFFSCSVEGSAGAWAYATHVVNAEHVPACVLHTKLPLSGDLDGPLPTSLTLAIRARDRGASYEAITRASLPFAPGFATSRRGTVQLSARMPRLVLDVAVPPRIEIVASSSDASRLVVRELAPTIVGQAMPDMRRFEVRPASEPSAPFSDVTIALLDPASGQEESLVVSYAPDAPLDGSSSAHAGQVVAVESPASHAEVGLFGLKPIDALMLAIFLFISALLVLAVRCLFSTSRPVAAEPAPPAIPTPAPSAFMFSPRSTPFKHSSPFGKQSGGILTSGALRRGPPTTVASPPLS